VGAGDAFVAGYLASILGGLSPADSIIRATVCGTLACTHSGDWEGSPTSVQLESLLEAARQ